MVISAVPSNACPLIVLAVASLVAFAASVAVAELPVTLPAIGFVTVRPARVPTVVNEELTILAGKPVPVSPLASTGKVIFAVPSKATPLIVRAVVSLAAVVALPVTLPAIGAVTVNPLRVPTEVMAGCAAFVTTKAVFAVISTGIHCVPFHPNTWPETGAVDATLFPLSLFAFQIADALFADSRILAPVLFTVIVVSSPSNVTAPTFPFIETTDPDASAKLAHAFL